MLLILFTLVINPWIRKSDSGILLVRLTQATLRKAFRLTITNVKVFNQFKLHKYAARIGIMLFVSIIKLGVYNT